MKTSKIITTLATLNLVLFMSVSSIAKPVTIIEGDIIKSGVKKQIEVVKNSVSELTSNVASEKEFSHLRFDVNKFNTETEVVELPLNQFNYLRFDVNSYNNASEILEMPVNEYDYLRFDVNKYSDATSVNLDELPVN